MRCILDSAAAYALVERGDQHHERARAFVRDQATDFVLTSIVAGECYTLMLRRAGYRTAMEWRRSLDTSPLVNVHMLDAHDEVTIWSVLREYAGVPISYADASLIVLGKKLGIRSIFTFDSDFRQAGLNVVP